MSYITHARASLTPQGRLKMVLLVINEKWTQARVAERFQIARGTASKWWPGTRLKVRQGLRTAHPGRAAHRTARPSAPSDGSLLCA
ncbi:leucine zipper domain-containing protein [Glutamicibacter creatinolyticus]